MKWELRTINDLCEIKGGKRLPKTHELTEKATNIEVNETYTTQACSCCGCISSSSPKGRRDLEIREWTCAECGTTHDRDINAAKNILRLGHQSLTVGIPFL